VLRTSRSSSFIWSGLGKALASRPSPRQSMRANTSPDTQRVLGAIGDIRRRLTAFPLDAYLDELFTWNPQLGLISKQDSWKVAVRLIQQSVALWVFVSGGTGYSEERPCRVADVGSGGGFPGLVWRCLLRDLPLTLIERKERRAYFLERVARRLHLEDVTIVCAELREVVRQVSHREGYDVAVTMAVSRPEQIAGDVARLLSTGGYFASVRPRAERKSPEDLPGGLCLAFEHGDEEGRYVLYRKIPPPE
jgi:16S rRNA (guanine(527)-N(7))-methyltransferase RsmG